MRLDKFVVMAGAGKRKDARGLIEAGRILVNGDICSVCAVEIDENNDIIQWDSKVLKPAKRVYYMLNKPAGYMTALKDSESKVVFELFNPVHRKGLFHVGRLDKDTEGMLLFTNDGEFEHSVMDPLKHVVKKYFFIALGVLDEDKKKRLTDGVSIGKDEPIARAGNVEIEMNTNSNDEDSMVKYDIRRYYQGFSDKYTQSVTIGSISISEGRKHQVKRMLKAVGCQVIYLRRVSIGGLTLDENLNTGEYRELKPWEVNKALEKE